MDLKDVKITGDKLREARETALPGTPAAAIARLIGTSRQNLFRIESGLTTPSSDLLVRMVLAYDIDLRSFFENSVNYRLTNRF